MLKSVLQELTTQLAGVPVKAGEVRFIRVDNPVVLTQTTNLTGLYAETSFLSEMVSQNLIGTRLEVIREEGRWCYVRQEDGYLGWAYRPYYGLEPYPAATHIVSAPVTDLHRQPLEDSPLVTLLLAGTMVRPQKLAGEWTWIELPGGMEGYLQRAHLHALQEIPGSEAGRRSQMIHEGLRYIGTPYTWGGCSGLGIDCSGLAQLLHRLVGVTIPRDADMQRNAGRKVEPPYQPGDLVFFSDEPETRRISHVGVSMGGWVILHSSRSRNGVYMDDIQTVSHLKEMFVDGCTYLAE